MNWHFLSASFVGLYDFDAWNISHEFMMAFMKVSESSFIKKKIREREICEFLSISHNSFHSAVNVFTALEKKHDKIVGKIKLVREERNCGITM